MLVNVLKPIKTLLRVHFMLKTMTLTLKQVLANFMCLVFVDKGFNLLIE